MRTRIVVALVALAVALAACGGDDDNGDGSAETDGEAAAPLTILVTNDDGVAAPGIDALATALAELPDVEVVVVAPAENNSGTGGQTTPGAPADLVTTETTTQSGIPATAVDGFPADAVNWALAEGIEPDLVVSGANLGQNLGPITEVSGTVGAARAAFTAGIPALAVSAGFPDPPDYAAAIEEAVALVAEFGEEEVDFEPVLINLNVPTCAEGEVRGTLDVPLAASDAGAVDPADCTSTLEDPVDDIQAFVNGYATITVLEAA